MKSLFVDREVLILDGAMGTQLILRGLKMGEASIAWNVDRPQDVLAVQKSYADAGSNCLTTNTFSGSPIMMQRSGLSSRFEELNRAAVAIAKEASAGRCHVLGDIGPCGDFLEPLGELEESKLAESVKKQARILVEAGVDGFIVETMSDPDEIRVSIEALVEFGLPIVASFTYERSASGMQTMMGTKPNQAVAAAIGAGARAVGANCGTSLSLHDYLVLVGEILRACGGAPVMLQPNAGSPKSVGENFIYDVTPAHFATWAQAAVGMGVQLIGGCCGTTPAHIRAASQLLHS